MSDDQMIQQSNVDQRQSRFQPFADSFIGSAGLRDPGRVVMGEDYSGRIDAECLLNHLSGIYGGAINGTPEQLVKSQHAMAIVEIETAK